MNPPNLLGLTAAATLTVFALGCASTKTTTTDGKTTVTQTTTQTAIYPVAMPNPTPYSGIPAFVGINTGVN